MRLRLFFSFAAFGVFGAFGAWGSACAPAATTTRPTTTSTATATDASTAPVTGSTTSSPSNAGAAVDGWRARPESATCQSGLTALAKSELAGFTGVAKCGRIDAEKALGDSGDHPSRFEQFGEYRVYKVGKESITVWFLSDDVRVVQTLYPKLGKTVRSVLGEPQAKLKSQLSADWEQWAYPSRGLVLHVRRTTSEPVMLFAFVPMPLDQFGASDIARVSRTETPIEELR